MAGSGPRNCQGRLPDPPGGQGAGEDQAAAGQEETQPALHLLGRAQEVWQYGEEILKY